jgi:hypothetical protein
MALLTFKVKFLYGTRFLFRTLMFAAREDKNLELLTQGPTPSHHASIYGEASYYLADRSAASTSGGACSGLNPYASSYAPTAMTSWGTQSGLLCPGPWPKHRALLHRTHLPVGTRLKTTLRLRATSAGTLSLRPTTLAWWVLPWHLSKTTPQISQH